MNAASTSPASAPAVRPAAGDPRAGTVLAVRHETRYEYAAPVSLAHHLAHLQPMTDAHQQVLSFDLTVEPAPDHRREGVDDHANPACWFSLTRLHSLLDVVVRSEVAVRPRFDALDPSTGPAWETLAARLRYVAKAPFVPEGEYALPSPYVPLLPALRAWAAPSVTPGRTVASLALALMSRVHAEFTYQPASTQVDTPLAQVLALKRGVCQDFAHLLIGALRSLGVPARYVSGYLLTQAPAREDGTPGEAMVGADATHAWVQAWCPGTRGVPADGWLDLDPTNDLVPRDGHVRLAVGRDYGDVAPLRGVIHGGGRHRLSVGVHTEVLPPKARDRALPVANASSDPSLDDSNPRQESSPS